MKVILRLIILFNLAVAVISTNINQRQQDIFVVDTFLDFDNHGMMDLPYDILTRAELFATVNPCGQLELENSLSERDYSLLLQNGINQQANAHYLFVPERGLTIDDYIPVHYSSDPAVLEPTDNDIQMEVIDTGPYEGSRLYNITVNFIFQNFVGRTEYRLSLHPKNETQECGELTSSSLRFLVSGLVIYESLNSTTRHILTGEGRSLTSSSYTALLEPEIREYRVLVQYPNGSSSTSYPQQSFQRLGGINPSLDSAEGQIRYDFSQCSINGGFYLSEGTPFLQQGCGFGFALDIQTSINETMFLMKFTPYTVGSFRIVYDWPTFDQDEVFSTFLDVAISSPPSPPPVAYNIGPQVPFRPTGAQEITVYLYNSPALQNASFNILTVEGTTIKFLSKPGSFEAFDNYTQRITFITAPGTNSTGYNIQIQQNSSTTTAIILDSVTFNFTYAAPPQLGTVSPSSGTGGQLITLTGSFEAFDPALGDRIYFNGIPVDPSYYRMTNETLITFILPPRNDFGIILDYNVTVEIAGRKTDPVLFSYDVALDTQLLVLGSRFNTSTLAWEVTEFTTLVEVILTGTPGIQYKWNVLVEGGGVVDLPLDLDTTTNTLYLKPDYFNTSVIYIVQLNVSGPGVVSVTNAVRIFRPIVPGEFVSITITPSSPRFIFDPPTSELISVSLLPVNVDLTQFGKLEFVWEYNDKNYSSRNPSDIGASATKLGRSFLIPPEELIIGETPIRVLIYGENGQLMGVGDSVVNILPSNLIAIINNGTTDMFHNIAENLLLSGLQSYDPDNPDGSNRNFIYQWDSCIYASNADFSDAQDCKSVLIGNSEFFPRLVILVESFVDLGITARTYLRIGLRVSQQERSGAATVTYILDPNEAFARPLDGFVVKDHTGMVVRNYDGVDTSEIFIFEPQAAPTISWKYSILVPEGSNLLLDPTALLSNATNYVGYWTVEDTLSGEFNREPLGFYRHALDPNERYQILVSYFDSETGLSNQAVVDITTMAKPQVSFPRLGLSVGTAETIFYASAFASFFSSGFKYYFYLEDAIGGEVCLGGCTGSNTISFQYSIPGEYRIRVEVGNGFGSGTFAVVYNEANVTILPSNFSGNYAIELITALGKYQLSGDSNSMEVQGQSAVFAVLTNNPLFDNSSEEDIRAMILAISQQLRDLSNASSFTTALAESYTHTVCEMSLLEVGLITQETLLGMLSIVEYSVSKNEESYVFNIDENLKCVYNNTPILAAALASQGLSRRRLLQVDPDVINDPLLEVYEGIRRQFPVAMMKDNACGFHNQLRTEFVSPFSDRDNTLFPPSAITVSIACSDTDIITMDGVDNVFRFCEDVFEGEDNNRFNAFLAEYPDYVFFSSVAGNRSADVTFLSDIGFQNKETPEQFGFCYDITMLLKPEAVDGGPLLGYTLENRKNFNVPIDPADEYYVLFGFEVEESITQANTSIIVSSTRTGLFGATLLYKLIKPGNGSEPSEPNSPRASLSAGAAVGIAAAVTAFTVVGGLAAYNIANFLGGAGSVVPPPTTANTFVDTDVFGRLGAAAAATAV